MFNRTIFISALCASIIVGSLFYPKTTPTLESLQLTPAPQTTSESFFSDEELDQMIDFKKQEAEMLEDLIKLLEERERTLELLDLHLKGKLWSA